MFLPGKKREDKEREKNPPPDDKSLIAEKPPTNTPTLRLSEAVINSGSVGGGN